MDANKLKSAGSLRRVGIWTVGVLSAVIPAGILSYATQIPTTMPDYFQPGTQPNQLVTMTFTSQSCSFCHGGYDPDQEPYTRWAASMMGQAGRDPVFYAALAIANQDAAFAGDLCLRCHTPNAWLEGRSTPTDGSALTDKDREGVACHFCHRVVDPIFDPQNNPPEDEAILNALVQIPDGNPHTGQYVVDPYDRRRGPFELDPNFSYHDWRQSPYHRDSALCATCHDVSNPLFAKQPNGTYALTSLNQPHPTHSKLDEFPIERTYSEWQQSAFAQGPVEMGGRFGGNITAVSSCQDCHMPKTTGTACQPALEGEIRSDLPLHDFNGANSWVLRAVRSIYPDFKTGLNDDSVAAAEARTLAMMQAASDLELSQAGDQLISRIINMSGHKLPTGYPEGRRMWINVKFFNGGGGLIAERGTYNAGTAELDTSNTKVYHMELGVDAAVSALTGVPVGPGFHFALNNVRYLDNRIPPMGFTNAGFLAVQAEPVNYSYPDGQYWDDTQFRVPPGARSAQVRVFHQTTTKEYIEFLRDTNVTNTAGQLAYDLWVTFGKSAPVEMDYMTIQLSIPGDLDDDFDVDLTDLSTLLSRFGSNDPAGDVNGDGEVDLADLSILLAYFGTVG